MEKGAKDKNGEGPKNCYFCEGCNLPCPSPCKEVLHAIGQVTSQSVQGYGHNQTVWDRTHKECELSYSVNQQSRTCEKE
jgi:hypothetical protein